MHEDASWRKELRHVPRLKPAKRSEKAYGDENVGQ